MTPRLLTKEERELFGDLVSVRGARLLTAYDHAVSLLREAREIVWAQQKINTAYRLGAHPGEKALDVLSRMAAPNLLAKLDAALSGEEP